ncbi:hypothetical protein HY091_01350 [Candidatus Kaiserbacteria bacterium]|nr:hypothetical protein [Candidatus Kaiserbacteria bacterium]
MRKFGLSVIGAAVFALWAPSLAQASDTLTLGVTSNYVLQDLGIEASRNPGIILDRLHTSGNWTLEWWQRVDLGGGVYGNRGFGDEHDFSLTSDWLVSTFFGQMRPRRETTSCSSTQMPVFPSIWAGALSLRRRGSSKSSVSLTCRT